MTPRSAVAAATGRGYRAARRLGIPTRASRQEQMQRSRDLPAVKKTITAGDGDGAPLRLLLFGNGPAENPGIASGAPGFADFLAEALALRTRRRVEVTTLVGAAVDPASLSRTLDEERLHWQDALIVTAAYRQELAEVRLSAWRSYTEALRATLVDSAGPDTVIRVLSLPWRQAAREAPVHWGGLFGNRVRVVAEIAEGTLTPDQQALPLRLSGPLAKQEWIGPAFSAGSYLRWADQVAAEVARSLR